MGWNPMRTLLYSGCIIWISAFLLIDGEDQCGDGSDERALWVPIKEAQCLGFLCNDHFCIPNEWRCDGTEDCMDYSDEEDCFKDIKIVPTEDCTLDKGFFACQDQQNCINVTQTCDGIIHCPDGSDEGPGCETNKMLCPQLGCEHKCIPRPDLPVCVCPPGFKLKKNQSCSDIDECQEYAICSHSCSNRPGTYSCSCMEGYTLQNSSCRAEGGEGFLVFSTKTKLHGYYLSSRNNYSIVETEDFIAGVAYDGTQVYWTSLKNREEAILRTDAFGVNLETIVNTGLGLPEDLAIDWLTNNIYFTDAEEKHIGVCTTTGLHCTVLVKKDVDSPRAIVLLVSKGLMFWSDWGVKPMIARAGMDGSSPTTFVSSDIHWPNGIALDQGNERLYWVDSKLQVIESVKFDGTDRRVILKEEVKHPYSLVMFEDRLYWSDFGNGGIMSCHKFTGKNVTEVLTTKENVYGMNIYHPSLHPKMENPCHQAFCSDICLLAPNATYSCTCSEDRKLGVDNHTCSDVTKKEMLVLGTGRTLIQVYHLGLGRQQNFSTSLGLVNKIGAMTFNSLTGDLILSDVGKKELFTYNLERTRLRTLPTPAFGAVEGLDFDYMGNNLYWSDSQHKTVEVLNLATMEHKILLKFNDEVPLNIIVVPDEGVMFIAFRNDYDNNSHIDRYHMDGTSRTQVIKNVLQGSYVRFAYDPQLRRVFYCGANIESINVEGFDYQAYHSLDKLPAAVAAMGPNIFWTTLSSPRLHWSNKYFADAKIKGVDIDALKDADKITMVTVRGIIVAPNHPCQNRNGECSHLCLVSFQQTVCACPEDLMLGSDNQTCTKPVHCAKDQFKCQHDNSCIPHTKRCDGRSDCLNGKDEEDCTFCLNNQFTCANGQCINQEEHCDGAQHCSDGSDEWNCSEKTCNPDAPVDILLVVNGSELYKMSDDFNSLKIVHRDVSQHISGLDVGVKNQTVYWSSGNEGSIHSYCLVDKKQTQVKNVGRPAALAVDWITGNIYFIDETENGRVLIKVCNLDARLCAKLIAAESGMVIKSLAVDPTSGYLFWSETNYAMLNNSSSTIHRAELSGADPTILVTESLGAVMGVAADIQRGKLYWADYVEQKVECIDYNGEDRQTVFQEEVQHPVGLAVFEDNLYWISSESGSLMKCKVLRQNYSSCKWIHLNLKSTDHFAILQSKNEAEGQNLCLGHSCSHLCVLGVHGPRCLCEDGMLVGMDEPCKVTTAITLHHMPQSPPSRAAFLATKILGVDVNIKEYNMFAKEQKHLEYFKINPMHTVPTLDDDGFIVTDSHSIACYLANRYDKDDKIYPKDPQKRALVDQRLYFDAIVLFPRLQAIAHPVISLGEKTVSDEKKNQVAASLEVLDGYLAATGWVAGDDITIADTTCVATVSTFEAMGFDLTPYKNVNAWVDQCRSKIPDYQAVNQEGADAFGEAYKNALGGMK